MLVLTRKNQQSVIVGGSASFAAMLRVTVLEIDRGTVRLGFDVAKDVPVHRAEVWDKIQAKGRTLGESAILGDEGGTGP